MKFFKAEVHGLDSNGFLDNKHGGNASAEFKKDGIPTFSPKITWDAVEGAKSYALEIIDYDAAPVVGFPYIHWVVANIKDNKIEEGFHTNDKSNFLIGVNSTTQGFLLSSLDNDAKLAANIKASTYVGSMPPNKDHTYKINIFALSVDSLALKVPFFISDLHDAMREKIIAKAFIEFKYRQDQVSYK